MTHRAASNGARIDGQRRAIAFNSRGYQVLLFCPCVFWCALKASSGEYRAHHASIIVLLRPRSCVITSLFHSFRVNEQPSPAARFKRIKKENRVHYISAALKDAPNQLHDNGTKLKKCFPLRHDGERACRNARAA